MVLEARARPLVKKGPWWSWGLEARARPLVKKNPWWFWGLGGSPWWFWGLGRGPPRGPWSKRAPGSFGVWGGVLQEAPGQKGSLVVLEARARPLIKKGPGGFGVWGGVLQEAPNQIWGGVLQEAPSQRAPDGFAG